MSNPYPPTDPGDITGLPPEGAFAKAYRDFLSQAMRVELDAREPMPVLLGFPFVMTRPNAEEPDRPIMVCRMLLRCPAMIGMSALPLLRRDCTLDVQHAVVRGKAHAVMALSDNQMPDNMEELGHSLMEIPPNPIGWALEGAARRIGATCRQWRIRGGTEHWKMILRETGLAEAMMGMPAGMFAGVVMVMEKFSPQDVTDVTEATLTREAKGLDALDLIMRMWERPQEAEQNQDEEG